SPTTRTLFVKTPALTFSINPDRGRVETAFAPLYGATATVSANGGVPFYDPSATPALDPIPVPAGGVPAIGDIIPLRFVQETRDPNAGNTDPVNPSLTVPINQGITQVDLLDPINNRYTLATAGLTAAPVSPSPVEIFGVGSGNVFRGIRIIPGSEHVSAPVLNNGAQTSWVRVGAVGGVTQPASSLLTNVPPNPPPPVPEWDKVSERLAQYGFNFDEYPANATTSFEQLLTFDVPNGYVSASGMAASTATGANYLSVTYLWQNNFSRDPRPTAATWGRPLDPTGAAVAEFIATRPEADIFRVNYATRQQYSINLGARIYDPTDGRASSIRVSDKVIINNALR
ncbi:MAG: hypothetical protein H7Y38_03175, partial [Armatimonadetes bacterium]|nr:hypothetical protein [Armatimonadota bacterium]